MTSPSYFETDYGAKIAYHKSDGTGPGVVFLGGFKSDMEGTKAIHLEDWARGQGRAFLRFDYTGHGQSSGKFEEGSIGDWARDAEAAILALCDGPQILVGSSMGGWISSLLMNRIPDMISGFVGIAAAPDFTEDSMWSSFDDAQRQALEVKGFVELPSDYGEPYVITKRLIEDGRANLVLRTPLPTPFPVRLLQGTDDADVAVSVAINLLNHMDGPDIELLLVKGADHRFSDARCLHLIETAVETVLQVRANG